LYPDTLESKHQNKITLNLLANPPHDDRPGCGTGDGGHSHILVRVLAGGTNPRLRFGRQAQLREAGYEITVRAADRVSEKLKQTPLHALRNHVLPAAGLNMHFFPGELNDTNQKAFGEPVLAHYPGGERPSDIAEREVAVTLDMQQAVTLHPRHRLAHGRAALREPFGDPGAQRDDSLFF
jgi:hypothetical protein